MLSTGTLFLPHTVKTLTDHSKLPFEVVGSLKACKSNNNSQSCPKLLCLNDINDGDDDGDQKKSLIRRYPTATSF